MTAGFSYRYRQPLNTPEFRGAKHRIHSQSQQGNVHIERDVQIPTRFGFSLYADIFRPADASTPLPTLIAWTPYGKHDPAPLARIYPTSGVKAEWMSDLTIFEAPDPVYWTSKGYAVVTIDVPGVWYAQSPATYISPEENTRLLRCH
jgi:predicted acyl esterase